MKKILPLGLAVFGIVILLFLMVLFHFLVLAGMIPSDIVWGGNLSDKNSLYTMEAVSIVLNCLMLFIVLVYAGVIRLAISRKIVIGAIWLMALLFLVNTLGNLLAKNSLETYVFTPLTFLLSVFCFRIATAERERNQTLS